MLYFNSLSPEITGTPVNEYCRAIVFQNAQIVFNYWGTQFIYYRSRVYSTTGYLEWKKIKFE
jgi:hypothetical protein